FESQVVERLLERPVLVFTAAASFFERALNSFLLATVVLVQLVPQRFGGFRVCHAAGSLVFWERHRGMFRGPLQSAVDLSGDPLDAAQQDVGIFRRLSTESVAPKPLGQPFNRLLYLGLPSGQLRPLARRRIPPPPPHSLP